MNVTLLLRRRLGSYVQHHSQTRANEEGCGTAGHPASNLGQDTIGRGEPVLGWEPEGEEDVRQCIITQTLFSCDVWPWSRSGNWSRNRHQLLVFHWYHLGHLHENYTYIEIKICNIGIRGNQFELLCTLDFFRVF